MTSQITTKDILEIVRNLRASKPKACYFCKQPFGPWPYQADALWFLADNPKGFLGEICKSCNQDLIRFTPTIYYYD